MEDACPVACPKRGPSAQNTHSAVQLVPIKKDFDHELHNETVFLLLQTNQFQYTWTQIKSRDFKIYVYQEQHAPSVHLSKVSKRQVARWPFALRRIYSRTVPGPFRNLPTPVPKFHETWYMPAVCPIAGGGLDADRSIWSDSSVGKCSLLGKFLQNTRIWSMMCRMISTEGEWQRVQAIRVSR